MVLDLYLIHQDIFLHILVQRNNLYLDSDHYFFFPVFQQDVLRAVTREISKPLLGFLPQTPQHPGTFTPPEMGRPFPRSGLAATREGLMEVLSVGALGSVGGLGKGGYGVCPHDAGEPEWHSDCTHATIAFWRAT